MKRIAMILLALLLLPACGRAMPAPATIPFVPISGESNGVKWRTLDLEDEANAELKEELLRQQNEDKQTEFQMGTKKIVYEHGPIEMVDETGKRTVLLDTDKRENTSDADEINWRYPRFVGILDDRYFLFAWDGWEWLCGYAIYDIKEAREIPIEYYEDMFVKDGIVYSSEQGGEAGYTGPLHLWKYDWKAIVRGETAKAIDLLAGFSGPDAKWSWYRLLTSDARYFIADNGTQLCIYDLVGKQLIVPTPESAYPEDGFGHEFSDWNGAIYLHDAYRQRITLEITLP